MLYLHHPPRRFPTPRAAPSPPEFVSIGRHPHLLVYCRDIPSLGRWSGLPRNGGRWRDVHVYQLRMVNLGTARQRTLQEKPWVWMSSFITGDNNPPTRSYVAPDSRQPVTIHVIFLVSPCSPLQSLCLQRSMTKIPHGIPNPTLDVGGLGDEHAPSRTGYSPPFRSKIENLGGVTQYGAAKQRAQQRLLNAQVLGGTPHFPNSQRHDSRLGGGVMLGWGNLRRRFHGYSFSACQLEVIWCWPKGCVGDWEGRCFYCVRGANQMQAAHTSFQAHCSSCCYSLFGIRLLLSVCGIHELHTCTRLDEI